MNQQQLNFFEPISEQIKPPNGNKKLVENGPLNEGSDYRIHVGYLSRHIYVFPTKSAQKWIAQHGDVVPLKGASQAGTTAITGEGWPAPISQIDNLTYIYIPPDIYNKYPIARDDTQTTSEKGKYAAYIAYEMLKRQLIPLPLQVDMVTEKDLQLSGTDIIVKSLLHIQVKCDYKAGLRNYGGTGNVFLQKRECNLFRRY